MNLSELTRRRFLFRAGVFSAALPLQATPLALSLLAAGSAIGNSSDYRALVCLFMSGGNDAMNMVLPTDAASWRSYQSGRASLPDSIALMPPGTAADATAPAGSPAALGGVRSLTPLVDAGDPNLGRGFALHPEMVDAARLFDNGRLAIVPNVGPLIQPLTPDEYLAGVKPRPARLFSHNDQVSTWQALAPDGARTGWAGRLADRVASLNGSTAFTAVSTAGQAVLLSGDTVFQYQVGPRGAEAVAALGGSLFGSSAATTQLRGLLADTSDHFLARERTRVVQRSITAQASFQAAFDAAQVLEPTPYRHPITRANTNNPLAQQLKTVARIITARDALQVRRQVFHVSLGGFDTHDGQNRRHADLMARVSHAIGYFDTALEQAGLLDNVTLFTASDFGRSLSTNGDGTDHGWGGHHLVTGGRQVLGGRLHGRFPSFDRESGDLIGSGSLLPSQAVEQLGSTLGRWFGVSDSELVAVFPNLSNFATRDLGFLAS
jgi:uncharacterized protein (DUF1501 family)